jgi:hypothetical protein
MTPGEWAFLTWAVFSIGCILIIAFVWVRRFLIRRHRRKMLEDGLRFR